jgi:hypothetical protein
MLLIGFLAGAPFLSLAAGQWAYARGLHAEYAEQAHWHPVPAVVLGAERSLSRYRPVLRWLVRVRWTGPDRVNHTGDVAFRAMPRAGSSVMVRIDGSGRLAGPLLPRSRVVSRAVLAALAAAVALAALLLGAWALARHLLERKRLAAWDAEWRATGPLWSGQP